MSELHILAVVDNQNLYLMILPPAMLSQDPGKIKKGY